MARKKYVWDGEKIKLLQIEAADALNRLQLYGQILAARSVLSQDRQQALEKYTEVFIQLRVTEEKILKLQQQPAKRQGLTHVAKIDPGGDQ